VAELPIPELVENRRRSVAMLTPGVPALNREEALELLEQLAEALRRVSRSVPPPENRKRQAWSARECRH
jgi:hypothetical protein